MLIRYPIVKKCRHCLGRHDHTVIHICTPAPPLLVGISLVEVVLPRNLIFFNLAIFSSGMRTGVSDFSYKQTMFALINSFGMLIQKSNSYLQTFIRRFLLVRYRPIRTSVASGRSARRTFPYRVVQGKYLKLIWKLFGNKLIIIFAMFYLSIYLICSISAILTDCF